MPSTAIYDGVLPTLEQEAPDVPNPRRAVEVFTDAGFVYLRLGPVEGMDDVHGSYTIRLEPAAAATLIDALKRGCADR